MRKRHRYVTVIVNGDTGKTLVRDDHKVWLISNIKAAKPYVEVLLNCRWSRGLEPPYHEPASCPSDSLMCGAVRTSQKSLDNDLNLQTSNESLPRS